MWQEVQRRVFAVPPELFIMCELINMHVFLSCRLHQRSSGIIIAHSDSADLLQHPKPPSAVAQMSVAVVTRASSIFAGSKQEL